MQNINRDFMGWFGPGLMAARVKEAAPALADKIEKLIKAAQAALSEQTQEQIDEMIAQEVQRYAQELSEDEVKALRDSVRDLLRERKKLQDQPRIQGFKSAREASPAVRVLLEQSRSVREVSPVARVILGGVSRKSAKPKALVYPPKPRDWGRRFK